MKVKKGRIKVLWYSVKNLLVICMNHHASTNPQMAYQPCTTALTLTIWIVWSAFFPRCKRRIRSNSAHLGKCTSADAIGLVLALYHVLDPQVCTPMVRVQVRREPTFTDPLRTGMLLVLVFIWCRWITSWRWSRSANSLFIPSWNIHHGWVNEECMVFMHNVSQKNVSESACI